MLTKVLSAVRRKCGTFHGQDSPIAESTLEPLWFLLTYALGSCVWVIQELVMPSQIEIFLGSLVFPWRWLLDTWAFIGQLGLEHYIPVTSAHWIEGFTKTNQSVLVKTKHSNGEGNASWLFPRVCIDSPKKKSLCYARTSQGCADRTASGLFAAC